MILHFYFHFKSFLDRASYAYEREREREKQWTNHRPSSDPPSQTELQSNEERVRLSSRHRTQTIAPSPDVPSSSCRPDRAARSLPPLDRTTTHRSITHHPPPSSLLPLDRTTDLVAQSPKLEPLLPIWPPPSSRPNQISLFPDLSLNLSLFDL